MVHISKNLWDITKVVFRENFITFNAYIRKEVGKFVIYLRIVGKTTLKKV